MNLAFYATGHGYGHLTRTLAIVREVQRFRPDVSIHIRAPYPERMLLETLEQHPSSFAPVRLDIGLIALDSIRYDLPATLEQLSFYYGPEGDRLVEKEANWLRAAKIDAALLDIPPRAFEACRMAGVPAYGFSNFSWDDIWYDLAEETPELLRYADRAREACSSCALLFRPPMNIGLEAFPRVEAVPLVARLATLTREESRQRLGLGNETRPLVLLAFGGEGLKGASLPDAELRKRYRFLLTPPMTDPGEDFLYLTDERLQKAGVRYPDLIHTMDIVMSKPGYSTVAESAANHVGLTLTDRVRFLEGPAIQQYARDHLPYASLTTDCLLSGDWGTALDHVLEQLPFDFSGVRRDGAEVVARRLLEEVNG